MLLPSLCQSIFNMSHIFVFLKVASDISTPISHRGPWTRRVQSCFHKISSHTMPSWAFLLLVSNPHILTTRARRRTLHTWRSYHEIFQRNIWTHLFSCFHKACWMSSKTCLCSSESRKQEAADVKPQSIQCLNPWVRKPHSAESSCCFYSCLCLIQSRKICHCLLYC